MSETVLTEVCVCISKVDGGYVLDLPTGRKIVTSLNAAIKVVKDVLTPDLIPQ
jgi:hypothetical protein